MRRAEIFFIIGIFIAASPVFSFAARMTIPAELSTETLRLNPRAAPEQEEGRIYYNSAQNQFYFCTDSGWQVLGGAADNSAAAIIIAAYNSFGSEMPNHTACTPSEGSGCANPKANITCDGVNDGDTIECALQSLGDNGGTVYLLEGTYDNNGITFARTCYAGHCVPDCTGPNNNSGKALIGQGPATVLRHKIAALSGPSINISEGQNLLVSNLTLDGNNVDNYAIDAYAGTANCVFKNIRIIRKGRVRLRQAQWNRISYIDIEGSGPDDPSGISLEGASNNIITHNTIRSDAGILLQRSTIGSESSSYNIITHNRITGAGGINSCGINVGVGATGNYSGPNNNYNAIAYNHIESTAPQEQERLKAQIRVEGSSYNRIAYNTIKDSAGGSGIRIKSYDADSGVWLPSSSLIIGNRISNNFLSGIRVEGIFGLTSNSGNNIISENLTFDNATVFGSGDSDNYAAEISLAISNRNIVSGNFLFQEPLEAMVHTGVDLYASYENYLSHNYCHYSLEGLTLNRNNYVTGIEKYLLEPGPFTGLEFNGTLTPVGPVSYMRLDVVNPSSVNTLRAIAPGKAIGDILILEGGTNTDTAPVTVPNGAVANTMLRVASETLNQFDTMTLIWNGTRWVELSCYGNDKDE